MIDLLNIDIEQRNQHFSRMSKLGAPSKTRNESLRIKSNSLAVQSAVFLCFRVILIRMSASNITKFWPLIITEMMVIFSYLEKEISNDTEEWRIHLKRMSTLESSWFGNNGVSEVVAHDNPAWLSLYLSVCKVLDLALALPTHKLPQFQMYRWAFVSESTEENRVEDSIKCLSDNSIEQQILTNGTTISENHLEGTETESSQEHLNAQDFVPYVVRVARLLLQKVKEVKPMTLKLGEPQLTMTSICSLEDLAPFLARPFLFRH